MAISSTGSSSRLGGSARPVTNIGEWWQDLVTTNEIAKIRASQEAEVLRIETANALNQKIFDLTSGIVGDIRGVIGASPAGEVPSEFDDLVALFQEGGQFGAGAKAEIERGSQQALAAGQLGLAQTGLSSGTNVAGLQARISADTALSKAKIEDSRVAALGGALEAKGTATLATRSLAQQQEASRLNALVALTPNFVAA